MNIAKNVAIQDASKFGMNIEPNEIEFCEIADTSKTLLEVADDSDEEMCENFNSKTVDPTNSLSSLIEIPLENGAKKTVRKSSFLWSLTDPRKQLSKDRLKRVQEAKAGGKNDAKQKQTSRRLIFKKDPANADFILSLSKTNELQIGDWCVFLAEKNNKDVVLLGHLMSFKYIEGRTMKSKQYSWEFAPVVPQNNVTPRGIEVLASWFEIETNTNFFPADKMNSFYININKYIATLVCPNIKIDQDSGCLSFTNETSVLQRFIEQLLRLKSQSHK